ncbi:MULTISPECIES: Abi family protein [Pseudomonas]|uniref:Abi family protein n=1 Tax=Pseudomonas putida TaxID=303 RepID=A0A7U6LYX4_PSEPU|nr:MULTISPECIES: Abi family protein [Pseudomonas]MDD2122064.1 Abi family protein [Pseudomonas monteilii]BBU42838.1 abi family protein [Pseudomonas putida]
MDQPAKVVKPFLEYDQLVKKLSERGMLLHNPLRAQRKLTQVGYYRLSGYWSPALKYKYIAPGNYEKLNEFKENTSFESIFDFYLFDKKLRLELMCAIERIEVYLRTIIAHELGRHNPLAYLDKKNFSKFALIPDDGKTLSDFESWQNKHESLLKESREESIKSHIETGKPIPIWVACEAWNFGTVSKLYSMLNGANQKLICDRLGIDNRQVIDNWLININGIRNRCAHHSRVCNRPNIRTLMLPKLGFFNTLKLGSAELNKLYGFICVLWFLVSKIGQSSNWICRIADLVDNMPKAAGLNFKSMGFGEGGFPRKLFPQTDKKPSPAKSIEQMPLLDDLFKKVELISAQDISIEPFDVTDQHIEKLIELAMKLESIKKADS